MQKPRLIASLAVAAAAVVGVFMLPIPHYVRCGFYVQPRGASSVYVESGGELQAVHARPGDWVDEGQLIATLNNVDAELAIIRLVGERHELDSRLQSLRQRAFDDEAAALEITEVQQAIAALDDQLSRRQQDLDALQIKAPVAGLIVPPPTVPKPRDDTSRLPSWYGSPFEPRNVRAFLTEGVPLCQIGNPDSVEAILAIDEGDIEFVHSGLPVDIFVAQFPGRKLSCRLEHISQLDIKVTPRSLSSKSGGDLVTQTDASGTERPMSTTYQANVPLNGATGELLVGATGQAKIHAGYQTVATRLWRYVCQTFNFDV